MFEGSFLARSRHMAGMSKGTAKMSNANVKNLKVKTHLPPPRAGPVTLGSDCSGWESLSKAAKCIGLNAKLKFASDINVHCRTMIAETEDSDVKIYHDTCTRAPGDAGSVDVYGAGFPCQPFSSIGKRRGATDARAGVTAHILKFIASAKPRCFILENVKGLLDTKNLPFFSSLITTLSKVRDHDGTQYYAVHWSLLNTMDYGIPQNRCRLYIVGWAKKHEAAPFAWPSKVKMAPLETFLDPPEKTPQLPSAAGAQKRLLGTMQLIRKRGGDLKELD